MPSRKNRNPVPQISTRIEHTERMVQLDTGEYASSPSASEHDLYIGRLVTHTSSLVSMLTNNFGEEAIVQAHHQLVLPLMHRHQLAKTRKPARLAQKALDHLYTRDPFSVPIYLQKAWTAQQVSGTEFAVRMDFKIPCRPQIRGEMDTIQDYMLEEIGMSDDTIRRALVLRIASTPDECLASEIAESLNEIHFAPFELTLPLICGAPKQAN